ncbi:MAG: hypothetical protein R3C03_17520 [Pirellulaceae bacterium]
MAKVFRFTMLIALVLTAMSTFVDSSIAGEQKGDRVRLVGTFPGLRARVRFEARGTTRAKFNFEIQRGTPGVTGSVTAATASGSVVMGSFTIDALGVGKIDIDTQEGDSVPTLEAGTVLTLDMGGNTYTTTLN